MQKTKQRPMRLLPYWVKEIASYVAAGGWRTGIGIAASPIFWQKLGRVVRHRAPALAGRFRPLQPTLEALAQRPAYLHLEFTNACNANCVFCPYQYQKRSKQLMSESVFHKAVHDYVELGGGAVGLTPIVGDALLHPDFVRWVRYLRSFRSIAEIELTTNGILLDKHGFQTVLDCGISGLIISTAGFDEQMYERMYRNDCYQRMRSNVEGILKANARRSRPLPIRIALRPDRPLFEVMQDPDFQPILAYHPPLTFHFAFGAAGGRLLNTGSLPGLVKIQIKPAPSEACESLFRGPIVLSDGTVSACSCSPAPMDAGDLLIGNILESSLLDLWRSEKMNRIRTSFQLGCRPVTCQGCGQYEGLDLFRTPSGRRMAKNGVARAAARKQNTPVADLPKTRPEHIEMR